MVLNLQIASSLLMMIGICTVMSSTVANAAVQTLVPEEMRGRVLSILAMIIFGIAPFGNLTAGWVAGMFGVQKTLAFGGALCLILAIVIFAGQIKLSQRSRCKMV
jgi:MFS family permease